MAGKHVISAVTKQLEVLEVQLDDRAVFEVHGRAALAESLQAPAQVGDDEGIAGAADPKVEVARAKQATIELVGGLRAQHPSGPYSTKDLEAAFAGLCPLWPFC